MPVEVLLDKKSNDLSIVGTDDSGVDFETTLDVESAWVLVTALNVALRQLREPDPIYVPFEKPTAAPVRREAIDLRIPPRMKEAVMAAVDKNTRGALNQPAGFPSERKEPIGLRDETYKSARKFGRVDDNRKKKVESTKAVDAL